MRDVMRFIALLLFLPLLISGGRQINDTGRLSAPESEFSSLLRNGTLRLLECDINALDQTPLEGSIPESYVVNIKLESIIHDWRPYFVLGVGELLGYIVRSITGAIQLHRRPPIM